jgi:hypothetical protein
MTLQTIEALVKHWVDFVKGHEKLILIIGAAALLFHFGEKGLTAWENHDKRIASIAQKKVDADTIANQALATQLAQLKLEITAKNLQLEAQITASKQKLVVQQKIDANLPLPELSARWVSLLALPADSITPKPDGTISVTTDAAHTTINEIEKIPQLTEQLLDTQSELKGCNTLSAKKDESITGLNKQLTDEQAARKDDQKLAAVKQKKAWLRGFKWGAIVGFVGGIWVRGAV